MTTTTSRTKKKTPKISRHIGLCCARRQRRSTKRSMHRGAPCFGIIGCSCREVEDDGGRGGGVRLGGWFPDEPRDLVSIASSKAHHTLHTLHTHKNTPRRCAASFVGALRPPKAPLGLVERHTVGVGWDMGVSSTQKNVPFAACISSRRVVCVCGVRAPSPGEAERDV